MKALFRWAGVGWLVLTANATAQSDSGIAAFLGRARVGSERYRDQQVALADGYHAMGVEAPAMGQHWIQPGLLVAGRLDPDRPPILEYATIKGKPVLVGVAYAVLLAPGEPAPDSPAGRSAWHSHGHNLEEESLRLEHADDAAAPTEERVAVLHVWVWCTNPAGPFTPLNWALPYLRAGQDPPASPGADAKAISLSDGGSDFWSAAILHALDVRPTEAPGVNRVLSAYGDTVTTWLRARTPGTTLTLGDRVWLSALWARMRITLLGQVDPHRGMVHLSALF